MKILCIALLALTLGACNSLPRTQPTVQHVVLVWFKDATTTTEVAQVRDHTLALQDLPGLRSIQVGNALPSPRPMVDDSFDLGVVMTFDSADAMQAYLEHPRHKTFVQTHIRGRVDRILVYDIKSQPY